MKAKYDYLIVGAGFFGAVFAREALRAGKKVLVIDRRGHIGGNAYTETLADIRVHKYGPHIFHTADRAVWDYVNGFAEFNRFINSPLANYKGELYNLPFNMNTFYRMWGVATPDAARRKIAEQAAAAQAANIANAAQAVNTAQAANAAQAAQADSAEAKALATVGRDIYEKLIKGYTEKQWGRRASELPASIISRLPVRFTYDNNYFNDPYQGVPIGGYTPIFEKLLDGADVLLNTDFTAAREALSAAAEKIVYTGPIDEYYGYRFGALGYRSLRFETEILPQENFQGVAVVNYTDFETPFTRIVEHRHFESGPSDRTVITREYPAKWAVGSEAYYPLAGADDLVLYEKYAALARRDKKILFGGRLGAYRYSDMDKTIADSLRLARAELFPPASP
ncbi:MAG: UDP-galactopyranose mutase [Clostridiales bacterium]|nr:UDP-galactopyranose mutase [Clostridiales bacterium]